MARLVMISIPDNVDAEAFVKAVEEGYIMYSKPHPTLKNEVSINKLETAKVEALWAKPTQFCECDDYAGVSAPTKAYRWMVHAKCAKPRKGTMQHPRDLTRPDTPAEQIPYYLGFRADSEGFVFPREKK